ncbi:MAG: hypothetical protein ACRCTG_15505 [Aestuariivirga sp.]
MLGFFKLDTRPPIEQPEFWFAAFHEAAETPWVRWVPGRFKHVSAVGYFREAKSWVVLDPSILGTRLLIFADTDAGLNALGAWLDNALVLRMPALSQDLDAMKARGVAKLGLGRLGFWCVPAVRHLLGIPSRALLPDGLLRDCLANGGTVALQPGNHDHDVHAEGKAGSGAGKPEGDLQAAEA